MGWRPAKHRDLLNAVVDRLEGDRFLAKPRLRRSLDQLRQGQVEALSAEESERAPHDPCTCCDASYRPDPSAGFKQRR